MHSFDCKKTLFYRGDGSHGRGSFGCPMSFRRKPWPDPRKPFNEENNERAHSECHKQILSW